MIRVPLMFPVYFAGNFALVVLGYESATTQWLPRWLVLFGALLASVGLAYHASKALARSYEREDRARAQAVRQLHR